MYNSIKNTDEKNPSCDGGTPMEVPAEFENDVTIVYTHSVTFEVNTILHRHKCCHILMEYMYEGVACVLSSCHRKTILSSGLLGGITFLSPCLTPTSSGLGMKRSYVQCVLQIKIPLSLSL